MTLGQISAVLAWGATVAYAVALLAFAVDLARLADARGARRRVPVPVDAAGDGAPPRLEDHRTEGTDDRAARLDGRLPSARRIAMAVTVAGFALHASSILLRALAAGRVPWVNMYEFTLVGTFTAVLTFLVLARKHDVVFLGAFVIGICTAALGLGLTAFYVPAVGVEPILQSPWLIIHVSIATIAVGLFTVAVAVSTLQLLKGGRPGDAASATADDGSISRRRRMLDSLPPTQHLEALAFRVNAVAFVLWTFTVMAGAVWAEAAWGRYWGWDPKEVWSFVVWVIYAAYLHARTTRGWDGRRAAWFVLAGYAAVIFNFTVVNLLIPGEHSYAF